MTKHKLAQNGHLLLELGLTLAVLAVLLPSLQSALNTQRVWADQQATQAERLRVEQSLDAFALSHGRLPCPAEVPNGAEAKQGRACSREQGFLPVVSLGMAPQAQPWRYGTTRLGQLGSPAEHFIHNPPQWQNITLQQFSDLMLAPASSGDPALLHSIPLIHVCEKTPNRPLNPEQRGCQENRLISPSALAWAQRLETPNPSTFHIELTLSTHPNNPVWMPYERLVLLWLQGGWLNGPQGQP